MPQKSKHKFTTTEHRAGGVAHAAAVRKRKDRQVNVCARRFAGLTGLEDLKWRPAFTTLGRVTLLLERTYLVLKERQSLLGKDGDLCRSIDVFRRLAETQAGLLKLMGLTPGAPLVESPDKEIEAAFQRIESLKRVDDGKQEPP